MKRKIWFRYLMIAAAIWAMLTGCSKKEHGLSPKNPVVVTIWHYYNGSQKEDFDKLVQQFNESLGMEKGIVVKAESRGSIAELTQAVEDSLEGKVGSEKMPNAFAAYVDTAYSINQAGLAVDLSQYLTKEEQSEYVDAYLEEGRLESGSSIKLFPIAKSTEVFAVNQTDWEKFASDTGASEEMFQTWEGIAKVAEEYYKWSGGKAFFGRDAFANHMLIGSYQLGHEIFQVKDGTVTLDFDRQAMKRIWDTYYVPYISGYFGSYGKFRSDDVKTGDLLAFVGSTSGVTFFPTSITKEDGTSYEVESRIYPLPNFEGTSPCAVQQGAGMLVLKSDATTEYATTVFLKWFTDKDINLSFAIGSGYLPVKKDANSREMLKNAAKQEDISTVTMECLETGIDIVNNYQLYTSKPFAGADQARNILKDALPQKASKDREAVIKAIESGMSHDEAVAMFDTDENFNSWYEETLQNLSAVGE